VQNPKTNKNLHPIPKLQTYKKKGHKKQLKRKLKARPRPQMSLKIRLQKLMRQQMNVLSLKPSQLKKMR
jgi:hypothetical protein